MPRIGFYSGTFDPLHDGHVAFAECVRDELALDQLIFLPERQPRSKTGVTDISVRTMMITARIEDAQNIGVLILPHAQFTITDTLPELIRRYPDAELVFLFGSDVAQSLATWPDIDQLVRQSHLAIGLRSDTTRGDIEQILDELSQVTGPPINYTIHETDHRHVASSQLR